MSLLGLLTQTVTVSHRTLGAADDHGNAEATWGSPSTYRARLEQRSGDEDTAGRNTQISEWLLILPPDAVISGRDRVVADGATFEVVGPPNYQRTPRGVSHVEAVLRYVEEG